MSQEADEIITILCTTEDFLRTQTALYLQFPSVLQVGLDAERRSQLILESIGFGELVPDEGTDELLRLSVDLSDEVDGPPTEETPVEEAFPPGFNEEVADDRLQTAPAPLVLDPEPEESGLGDPEETEDLLREAERTIGGAMGSDDPDTDEVAALDAGQDALVTIEDTSDPRSDLDGLFDGDEEGLDDSDLDGLGSLADSSDDDDDDDEIEIEIDEDDIEMFDLMADDEDDSPDEEETFVADLADIEKMKAKMSRDTPAVRVSAPQAAPSPRMQTPTPRVAGVAAVGVAGVAAGGAGVAAGLYGNPAVPTIRDRNSPKPAAAAIQIDDAQQAAAGHSSTGALLEEEEVLELGSSEDYGEEEEDIEGGGGLSLDVQEYDDEEEEEEEEEEFDDIELEELEPDDIALEPIDEGPTPEEIAALMDRAVAAVEDGDMEAGINLYSDALDSDPENVDAHVARGRLYLDYGDYSRAMSDFMHAESLQPDNPEPQIAVGDLHFARKDYSRAIDYFNEALKMSPDHAMAFCRRGISHYYRKHYKQALEDLNKARKLDDDIPNIRTYIAMAKKKAKR